MSGSASTHTPYSDGSVFPWSDGTEEAGPSGRPSSVFNAKSSSGTSVSEHTARREGQAGSRQAATSESTSDNDIRVRSPGSTVSADPSQSGRAKGKQPIDEDGSGLRGTMPAKHAESLEPSKRQADRFPTAVVSSAKMEPEALRPLNTSAGSSDSPIDHPEQQSGKSEAVPHMSLVSFPTQDLITLVASLLQRIAAANDKLRRDRVKETDGDQKVSPSSRPKSSRSSPPRSPSSRPDPADMVIPPFRPKASPSPPQRAIDQIPHQQQSLQDSSSGPNVFDPVQQHEQTEVSIAFHKTPKDAPTSGEPSREVTPSSAKSNGDSCASLSTTSRQIKWPSTTAAEHAVSHPSSLLCFHARNVPSIGIETYLQRILKYCPVTNDVFISLLVYFDRMSRKLASQSTEADNLSSEDRASGIETKGFAIDSYNVHRLVIAGITISSKFHSDVFYTNSRYAKVCHCSVIRSCSLETIAYMLSIP